MQVAPELSTRRAYLRPPSREDYDRLREYEVVALGPRWRHGGSTPAPESYPDVLWRGVLAQFLLCRKSDHVAEGLFVLYNAEFVSGHVYIGAARFEAGPASIFLEGCRRVISMAFESWPFRKIYAEVAGFNQPALGRSLSELFREEGRLRDHVYQAGDYWDLVTLALWREDWFKSRWADARK